MASTYEKIATNTLGSNASSVTFSSISGSYTDLVLIVNALGVGANTDENCSIQLNSDTGSNYSVTRLRGNGTTASSDRDSNATSALAGIIQVKTTGDTTRDTFIAQFQNYSNTTTNKSFLIRSNSTAYSVQAIVGLYRSTSAITSIKFQINSNNFFTGSTFTLYGILKEA